MEAVTFIGLQHQGNARTGDERPTATGRCTNGRSSANTSSPMAGYIARCLQKPAPAAMHRIDSPYAEQWLTDPILLSAYVLRKR
jgi:hypothetical protein